MIRCKNIVGVQSNGPHSQHDHRPEEWVSPQCKYFGSLKRDDPQLF